MKKWIKIIEYLVFIVVMVILIVVSQVILTNLMNQENLETIQGLQKYNWLELFKTLSLIGILNVALIFNYFFAKVKLSYRKNPFYLRMFYELSIPLGLVFGVLNVTTFLDKTGNSWYGNVSIIVSIVWVVIITCLTGYLLVKDYLKNINQS